MNAGIKYVLKKTRRAIADFTIYRKKYYRCQTVQIFVQSDFIVIVPLLHFLFQQSTECIWRRTMKTNLTRCADRATKIKEMDHWTGAPSNWTSNLKHESFFYTYLKKTHWPSQWKEQGPEIFSFSTRLFKKERSKWATAAEILIVSDII